MADQSLPATPVAVPGTPLEHPGGDATRFTEDELTQQCCCTCNKPVDENNSLVIVRAVGKNKSETRRCRACHNVRAAITRLTAKHGNLVKDFNNMDGDRLEIFYKEHSHLRGDDLKTKVEEHVQDWKSSMTRFEFNTDAEYLDEVDLKEKYSNKPDALTNILQNAQRYYCPVKKCTLYADPKYTSRVQDATENGTTEKRKGMAVLNGGEQDDEPKRKRNKHGATKEGKDTQQEGEKKIKAGDKKKLVKKIDGANAKNLQLLDLIQKAAPYGPMIPAYVLDNAKTVTQCIAGILEPAQKCVDTMVGDAATLLGSLEEGLEKLGVASTRLKSQMEQAADFK